MHRDLTKNDCIAYLAHPKLLISVSLFSNGVFLVQLYNVAVNMSCFILLTRLEGKSTFQPKLCVPVKTLFLTNYFRYFVKWLSRNYLESLQFKSSAFLVIFLTFQYQSNDAYVSLESNSSDWDIYNLSLFKVLLLYCFGNIDVGQNSRNGNNTITGERCTWWNPNPWAKEAKTWRY